MKLGALLGAEGRKELDRAAAREQRRQERARRRAQEAERNRQRDRGQIIRYHPEDR